MAKDPNQEKWIDRFRTKRRLVSMDLNTFSERWSIQLSNLQITTVITFFVLLIIFLTYLLLAHTPLREFLPGYSDGVDREAAIQNDLKIAQLEADLVKYVQQNESLRAILKGNIPGDTASYGLDTLKYKDQELSVEKNIEDSLLRLQIEEEQKFNLQNMGGPISSGNNSMNGVFFFTPLEGSVSQSFDPGSGHLGVDIVAPEKEGIKSTLDGTVIFASWTSDAGHVIQVQHSNNLISVYKHNSVLLKKVGERVEAGEPIAIIGNSGMYSTGAHLHFELWQNGNALDPQLWINF